MTLGSDDVQAAGRLHLIVQCLPLVVQCLDAPGLLLRRHRFVDLDQRGLLFRIAAEHDVGTAARHVRRDRDALRTARFGDDRRFALVLLRVEHLVRQPRLRQQVGEQFGVFDRRGADQNGLPALVALADVANDGIVALARGLVDLILPVDPLRRPVRRDDNRLEPVDFVELVRFGIGRPRHAGELRVHPEVVLERDRSERLVFALDLDVLLGLDRLMQAIGPAAARHEAPREFVDDDDLAVLHHVVLIAVKQRMRAQCGIDVVHQRDVLRRVEALALADEPPLGEHALGLLVARLGQEHLPRFFVERVVARLFDARAVSALFADLPLEQRRQRVHANVQIGMVLGLARDDERGAGFVDQDRVDFVDDGEIQRALNTRVGLVDHVVAQVIEAEFVVGAVGDIGRVGCLLRLVVHLRQVHANGKPEEVVQLAHPLGIALGEVVVDGHDVHASPRKGIQIGRERRHERFAFARAHFGDLAVMQHHAADHLHVEVAHLQHTAARLAADRERLGQQLVERLAARHALAKLLCFGPQLVVGQLLDLRLERIDHRDGLLILLDQTLVAAAKDLLEKTVAHRVGCASRLRRARARLRGRAESGGLGGLFHE